MKRLIALTCVAIMAVSVTACSKEENTQPDTGAGVEVVSSVSSEAETEPETQTYNETDVSSVDDNLSAAKAVYNAFNTAAVNCKAKTGAYPDAQGLIDEVVGSDIISVADGISVAVDYTADGGIINAVWVCSGDSITGGVGDVNLACYSPEISGNAINSVEYKADITRVSGGDWVS